MCDFVCETMPCAKSSLHWSIIHYQVTWEWHSGRGLEIRFFSVGLSCECNLFI